MGGWWERKGVERVGWGKYFWEARGGDKGRWMMDGFRFCTIIDDGTSRARAAFQCRL